MEVLKSALLDENKILNAGSFPQVTSELSSISRSKLSLINLSLEREMCSLVSQVLRGVHYLLVKRDVKVNKSRSPRPGQRRHQRCTG